MSGLPPKADFAPSLRDVSFVPIGDIKLLLVFRKGMLPPGPERERRRSRRYRSSQPEAESVEPDMGIALDADGRADEPGLVAPGTTAGDAEAWIAALEPRRSVGWRTVVGLVPAILNPLPDVTVHVV